MAQINLPRLDSAPLDYTDFHNVVDRWLTDLVDLINQAFTQLEGSITPTVVNIGGGGAGPIIVPFPGLTPSSIVIANLVSSTNPVTITNVTPGTNQFSITFSGDPGASAIISYIAFLAP